MAETQNGDLGLVDLIPQRPAAGLFVHVDARNERIAHFLGVDDRVWRPSANFRVKIVQTVPHVPKERSFGLIHDLGVAGLDVLGKRLARVMDAPFVLLQSVL